MSEAAFDDGNAGARPTTEPSWLTRLDQDEQAQAMAEFVVLLPIYLLLIIAMIYMGHLMLIRQQAVEAARVYAWANTGSGAEVGQRFLRNFSGRDLSAYVERQSVSDFNAFTRKILEDEGGASKAASELAFSLVNNAKGGNGTNLERREYVVHATYRFPFFGDRAGFRQLEQTATHVVYAYRSLDPRARRPIFREGFSTNGVLHPIENYTGTALRDEGGGEVAAYSPSLADEAEGKNNRYLPLMVYNQNQLNFDPGTDHNGHSCLWNIRQELGNPSGNASPFFLDYWKQAGKR